MNVLEQTTALGVKLSAHTLSSLRRVCASKNGSLRPEMNKVIGDVSDPPAGMSRATVKESRTQLAVMRYVALDLTWDNEQ